MAETGKRVGSGQLVRGSAKVARVRSGRDCFLCLDSLVGSVLSFVGLWTDSATMMGVSAFLGRDAWGVWKGVFWELPTPVDAVLRSQRMSLSELTRRSFRFTVCSCDMCGDVVLWSRTHVVELAVSRYSGFPVAQARASPFSWVKPGLFGPDLLPLYCCDCVEGDRSLEDELVDAIRWYGL